MKNMQWQIQGTPCYNKLTRGLAILLLTLCASPVNAGALYFYEFGSPTETGFAGAGMAARAQDAGTVFTNPAGMTRFSDSATLVSGGLLYLHAPFDASKQTTISGTSGSTTEFLPYGSFAYIHSVSDRLKLGVSAQNNFGLALDWGTNWVGRYSGTKVAILAPQVQPTVSFRVNKWLSLGAGAGLTLGYLDAKLRINQERENHGDGKMEYDDTDFAVQGNFGIMLEPGSRTRIGLRYLTETDLDFEDDPDFSRMAPSTEAITDRIGKLDLGMKMPQSVMLGVFHDLNDKWAILGSVGWEDWSEFGRVSVSVNDSSEVTNDLKFDDVWHFGVGAQYKYKPRWIINTGVAYDTGLSGKKHRSLAIPMGKMYRFGIGTEYRKRNDLTIGAAMDIMYEGDLQVDNESDGGRVDGEYENVFLSFFTVYAKWQ
jgi:long-chain fatty acid transport protein